MSSSSSPAARRRSGRKAKLSLLTVAASVILAGALARLLGSYLPDAGRELSHPHFGWLGVAVGVELVSMVAFSELQRTVLRISGTHVGVGRMLGLTFEANALSGSLPAGSAFASGYTFRRFRTWGASAPGAGYTLLTSGLLSTVAFGLLAVPVAMIAGGRSASPTTAVLAAVLLGATLLGGWQVRLHPAAVTRLLERASTMLQRGSTVVRRGSAVLDRVWRRRPAAGPPRALTFARDAAGIRPGAGQWSAALSFAALNWAADLTCLLAAARAVDLGGASTELAVVAYLAGMGAAGLSLVPGGLGLVEAAMVLTLSHGGLPRSRAIAVVLLYRLVGYLGMIAIGWTLWLIHTRHGGRAVATESQRAVFFGPGGDRSPRSGISTTRLSTEPMRNSTNPAGNARIRS